MEELSVGYAFSVTSNHYGGQGT